MNAPDAHGQTCLHEAARAWRTDVAEYLIAKVNIDTCIWSCGGKDLSIHFLFRSVFIYSEFQLFLKLLSIIIHTGLIHYFSSSSLD